jgi:hypothetical protein
MGRPIIQTQTTGMTPAMKRRLIIGALVVVLLVVIAVFVLHTKHVGVPLTAGAAHSPVVTWTQQPVILPGKTALPAQPR